MDELVRWLGEQLDEDERVARAASGSTVVGGGGNWQAAPGGDEWEASRTDCDEDELLVALRPGLPRPPEVMSGFWGAIVAFKPEFEDPRESSPLPQFEHAARHDPSRVLREIDAKRRTLVRCQEAMLAASPMLVHFAKQTVREMALGFSHRPGYEEAVAAFE